MKRGFTLFEILVSISIISIVVSLLLPAVSAARESARLTVCRNHQRQLVLAVQSHESTHSFFPSNGWGTAWVGMSDRGFGKTQPGSWIFSILPFCEQEIFYIAAPSTLVPLSPGLFQSQASSVFPLLLCPTRGFPTILRANTGVVYRYCTSIGFVARNDIAVNSGSSPLINDLGPKSVFDNTYVWPNVQNANGMAFLRSHLKVVDVIDGVSNVLYCGEKWAPRDVLGSNRGFDQPWTTGDAQDTRRFTEDVPVRDGSAAGNFLIFGSTHSGGCNFGFVDGSVRTVNYSIHPDVFRSLGNRLDGSPTIFD